MKRVLLALAAALALFFAGRALVRALASDETRIRWVVDDMIEGFNATRMNPILDGLAPDYLDETYGADRALLRAAATSVFFQAKDPATKQFLYRLEWRPRAAIAVDERGGVKSASVPLELQFFRQRGDAEESAWTIDVDGRMEEREDGWMFVRTETRTTSGDRIR